MRLTKFEPVSRPKILAIAGLMILLSTGLVVMLRPLTGATATTTILTSVSPAAPLFGQQVTLTATVVPAVSVGSVAFMDGPLLAGVGNVIAGVATAKSLTLQPGAHVLRAVYSGGGGNAGSQSSTLTYVVTEEAGAVYTTPAGPSTGANPVAIAVGDYNNDGIADLAVANDQALNILLGHNDGTFANVSILKNAGTVATADFNGDGNADLLTGSSQNTGIGVLLGKGDGTFTSKVFVSSLPGIAISDITVGDFNADGKADFAVVTGTSSVFVFLGNGDGTFALGPVIATGAGPVALAVADFNGDGKPDLATANITAKTVSVLLGDGTGSFTAVAATPATESAPVQIVAADINGDGIPDLAVPNFGSNDITILLGKGDGTFLAAPAALGGTGPQGLVLEDFDGDGKLDIEVVASKDNSVILLSGNGKGTFSITNSFGTGNKPVAVVAADFNGDGRADLAVADLNDAKLSLFLATAPAVTTTSLGSVPSPSTFGQLVTLQATVTPANAFGSVEFLDGTTVIGVAPVSLGHAVLKTSLLPAGNRSLRAKYSGAFQPSEASLTQSVTAGPAGGYVAAASPAPGTLPRFLALGDFNGDGKADLAVAVVSPFRISVLLGSGNGTFSAAPSLSVSSQPFDVVVGDFNRDGKPDLAVNLSQENKIAIFLGHNDGTFTATAVSPNMGCTCGGLVVGDFNGDGNPDLAVANDLAAAEVRVLLGKGDGSFQPFMAFAAGFGGDTLGVADFNNDGVADIAVSSEAGGLKILTGNGNGTFFLQDSFSAFTPVLAGAGDFNDDGNQDLAVIELSGSDLRIFFGQGDGTFTSGPSASLGTFHLAPMPAVIGDLDGDNELDIAIPNFNGGVEILLGNGDGTFTAAPSATAGSSPSAAIIADFNADGLPDLAVANSSSNNVSILLGQIAPLLSITKSHAGNFVQGQIGATYTLTVSNAVGNPATQGTVTVTENPPAGLALRAMAGSGWTCPSGGNTCSRSDPLQTGSFYPPVSVRVDVAHNASSPQVNSAKVSGGGGPSNSVTDSTTIIGVPQLSISKTHSGNFTQGQQGATYTLTVSNAAGAGSTSGSTVVTETPPAGLTLASMAGAGWSCGGTSCTRSDALVGAASYSPIQVLMNVSATAPAQVVNQATVSGGGSLPAPASDPTTINPATPALSISKSHSGNFTQGQQGATYTITVSNAAGAASTNGTVTVTENPPTGLTVASMAGLGWSCGGATCTRSDALAGGFNYAPLIVTVNVAANASSPLVNTVNMTGGGSASAAALDTTIITSPGQCAFSLSSNTAHVGSGAGMFMNTSATQIFIDQLTGTFTLNAIGCNASNKWTAVSNNAPVLSLHAGAFGSGSVPVYSLSGDGSTPSVTIGFAMFANTTGHARVATIAIAGQTFTLTQDASTEISLQRITRALFQTILGREPDSDGFAFWTGTGAPKDANGVVLINQMADGFYTSQEFFSSGWEVLSIYQAALGRLPAFGEWLAAVSPLRPGTAPATAVKPLLDTLTGSISNTAFVQLVIQNSWGRPPTAAELSQFVNQLNAGTSPTARVDFLNTTVFTNTLFTMATNPQWITTLYYTILVRDPDLPGFNFWVQTDTNAPGQKGIYFVTPSSGLPAVYAIKLATIGQAVPPNLNLLGFLGSPEFQSLIQGTSTPVSISGFYNRTGIYVDGSQFGNANSLDGGGFALSGNLLSSPQTWDSTFNGASFSLGPANAPNVISAAGQVIPLPAGPFSSLRMLATGVNGAQAAQTVKITFTDSTTQTFTQSFSDWASPQGFSGESSAVSMSYRDAGNGTKDVRSIHIYGYSFALNSAKTVASVTLPNNSNVAVLGLALAP